MCAGGDAYHESVLLEEAVDSLKCRRGGIYVDGTVGGGGHAALILERSEPDGFLLGMDVDSDALQAAQRRLTAFGRRKKLVKANYADLRQVLLEENISGYLPISWIRRNAGSAFSGMRRWICAWTGKPVAALLT